VLEGSVVTRENTGPQNGESAHTGRQKGAAHNVNEMCSSESSILSKPC